MNNLLLVTNSDGKRNKEFLLCLLSLTKFSSQKIKLHKHAEKTKSDTNKYIHFGVRCWPECGSLSPP